MTQAFKQTDIGLIPEDWGVLNISEVSKFFRGTSWRKSEESKGGILVISIPNIKDGFIDFDSKFNHYINKRITENKRLEIGDIIFVGSSGSLHNVGRNALVRNLPFEPIAFASFTFKAKVNNDKVDNNFFYHLVNSPLVNLQKYTKRAADGKFNFQLQEFQSTAKIPYMALPEQKKIAHILSKIQQAIETQEQIIKTTQELKKALMQKLFTEGLNDEPQKQTEIGFIPESWEVATIGNVCAQRKENYSPDPNGNTKYVGLEHMVSAEFYLSNHSYENTVVSSKYKFYKDDILYGKLRPYLDKAVITDSQGVCSTDIIVIKSQIDNKFLLSLLHSEKLLNHSIAHTSGVNHPRTSFDALSRFKFALPKPSEQKSIGDAIFKLEDKIIIHQNSRNQLRDVFNSMLNQLMTGQIRVKDIEFKLEEMEYS